MRTQVTAPIVLMILTAMLGCSAVSRAQGPKDKLETIKPVPFTAVHLDDEFWAPRIETNRSATIPYAFGKCEETGRVENFVRAGKRLRGEELKDDKIRGYSFDDTDIYKILEGASFGLSVKKDPKMEKYLDELIAKISAAQEPDGYLFTARTINPDKPHHWAGKNRWEKVRDLSHELYNMGHFYEAAVAHYLATGKKSMLNIATKNADLLCKVFGPGKNEHWPGHQIIEMGLCKLYRATGEKRYLDLAKFYLDTRGPNYKTYAQAHKKVLQQEKAVGHAVRATYMYSGMADVATLTGDKSYITAIDRIWENVVGTKLYITGGLGQPGGPEGFAGEYNLGNNAYCETCAGIGNVYWNHRLFMLHGDAKYIDVLERTLYNNVIDGVSLDGKKFFYPNTLSSSGTGRRPARSEWFGCACCPGNIARFIASVPGYVYAAVGDAVYVNLFAGGKAELKVRDTPVTITQKTRYPWTGEIKITIEPKSPLRFALEVRIPGWAQNTPVPSDLYRYMTKSPAKAKLKLNGRTEPLTLHKGYVTLDRTWKAGDTIELSLPMPIRRVLANDKVEPDRGRVAIERGPMVFTAEWPDNNGKTHGLILPDNAKLTSEFRKDMLGGIEVIQAKAFMASMESDQKPLTKAPHNLVMIPYYAWAHRGTGEMDVWLGRTEEPVKAVLAEAAKKAREQREREAKRARQQKEREERERLKKEKQKNKK
ncbi:MAG: glycoside hydrolase family 127 protein [Phycisphaerae bacterium]|nr:glycoside hydrolase family 127 protein [Phycisphaerae bacterium]